MRAEMLELLEGANSARNDYRRQGDQLRPLGKKARRTRASLLEAAYECFVSSGYRSTSIEDIQAKAGSSIGTFYQYFRDKADVMTTLVAEAILRSADEMFPDPRPLSSGGPRPVLEGFIRNYAHTAGFQAVWEEATHHEEGVAEFRRMVGRVVEASIAEQIAAGQQAGTIEAAVDPAESARALAAMVDRYCYLTFVVDGRTDDDSVDAVTELVVTLWQNALMLRESLDAAS